MHDLVDAAHGCFGHSRTPALEKLGRRSEAAEVMKRQWEAVLVEIKREELDATRAKLEAARSEVAFLRERARADLVDRGAERARHIELEEIVARLEHQVTESKQRLATSDVGGEGAVGTVALQVEVQAVGKREELLRSEISKLGCENRKLRESRDRAERLAGTKSSELKEALAKLTESRLQNSRLIERAKQLQEESEQLSVVERSRHRQKMQHFQAVMDENAALRAKLDKARSCISHFEQQALPWRSSGAAKTANGVATASDICGSGGTSSRATELFEKPPAQCHLATTREEARVSTGLRRGGA